MNAGGLLVVALGVFSLLGGVFDWNWFMENRKARFVSAILSRNGARIFYVVLGLAMIVLGSLVAAGVIEDTE